MESCSTSWPMLPLIGQFYWWRLLIGPNHAVPPSFHRRYWHPPSGQVYKGTFLYKIATFRQPFCFTHLHWTGARIYVIKRSLKYTYGYYADNMVWTASHHWRGLILVYKSTNVQTQSAFSKFWGVKYFLHCELTLWLPGQKYWLKTHQPTYVESTL